MPPPQLERPEEFLRTVPDPEVMRRYVSRLDFYRDTLEEVVYRAHHVSFKVEKADGFRLAFTKMAERAMGLRPCIWDYLPPRTAMRYMLRRAREFDEMLERGERRLWGDIRWSFEHYLSQALFWYYTLASLVETWRLVVEEGYEIPRTVGWRDAIVLYVIDELSVAVARSNYECVEPGKREAWRRYVESEPIITMGVKLADLLESREE